jgi:hypothetical protein
VVVVAVSIEPEKFAIEIEAIKTPKGLVPTVESLKRVVQGLNLLDADLARMNMKMEANIRALLREVKTLQKLVADDAIASESSVERLGTLAERFDKFEANLKEFSRQKPSSASTESAAAITTLQRDVGPALAQAVQRLEKMVGLLEKRIEEFTRELPNTIIVALRQAVAASAKPSGTKQRAKAESTESRSD